MVSPQDRVIRYYRTVESRLIYAFLNGEKRFGYYPPGQERIPIRVAQRNMIDRLADALRPSPGSLLLDAGCGEGGVALHLAARYNVRVEGVDILDFNIRKARKKALRSGLAEVVSFQVMDYARLHVPDGIYDAVYTMETLVHAPDVQQALAEFRRVLRPGGTLALFEYSMLPAQDMTAAQREIARIVNEGSGMYGLPSLVHGSFPRLLGDAGFTDIAVQDITPRVMPMLRTMYRRFLVPYAVISRLGLRRHVVNATAVVETYRNLPRADVFRYNVVTAKG